MAGAPQPEIEEFLPQTHYAKTLREYMEMVKSDKKLLLAVSHETTRYGKVVNDPVHGNIPVHPLLVKVMDTPEFQRLRFLKCLGCSCFVYPSATHSRFEHSLGVSHLSRRLVETLHSRQPELLITHEDILGVALAGLLHDIGHGPFSHTWELFMKSAKPKEHWEHEKTSVEMIDHLIEANKLTEAFKSFGMGKRDIHFVKELIVGPLGDSDYTSKPITKRFLFEIVANKRNGMDVDKFDYLARDTRQIQSESWFDFDRFLEFSRVASSNGVPQICFRDKDCSSVTDLFHTRHRMHDKVYQHRVTKVVEAMLIDAFSLADPYLKIPGKDGAVYRPSEAHRDLTAYTLLNDTLLNMISMDCRDEMTPARDLVKRIFQRDLYRVVGRTQPQGETESEDHIKQTIIGYLPYLKSSSLTKELLDNNLLVIKARYDYGMKDKNPMDKVTFYAKKQPDVAVTMSQAEISRMLPENFHEIRLLIVYRKSSDEEADAVEQLVQIWGQKDCISLKMGEHKSARSHEEMEPKDQEEIKKARRKLDQ